MIMESYFVQACTDGKFRITVFNVDRLGVKTSLMLPEDHESQEDAFEWANAHGLPILEATAIY